MCSLKGTLQQFHQGYLGDHKPLSERLKSQSGKEMGNQAGNYSGCIMGNVGSTTKSLHISGLCHFILCESVVLSFQIDLFLHAEIVFIDELFGL